MRIVERIREDESGQAMALTVMCMMILCAFMALAIDLGIAFQAQRRAQIAADQAAIAAALEMHYNGTANEVTVGQTAGVKAIGNFVTASEIGIGTPTSGYHTGTGYVQALVDHATPMSFMSMFGFPTMGVGARAVAGLVPPPSCVVSLDSNNDANTLWVKGNKGITAPTCGITVDSPNSGAFCDQGAAKVTAPYIDIVGGQGGGQCGKSAGSPTATGASPYSDPYAGITDPATYCNAADTYTGATVNSGTTLPAARVITTSGVTTARVVCFNAVGGVTLGSSAGATTLGSGVDSGNVFVFETGVTISNTVNVNGALDLSGGQFVQANGSSLNINATGSDNSSADTVFTYNSIGLMQMGAGLPACNPVDQSAKKALLTTSEPCLQVQFGSVSTTPPNGILNGIIYAPTSLVYLQDQGGGVQAAGVYSYNIMLNSSALTITNYSDVNNISSPLTTVELVE